jgi:NAD(P)-dependent dehydrogenase (short-subunit alcohol dehydrogenase family)
MATRNGAPTGRLAGKVGVVTGGASGIGLATARRFVQEGAAVVIGDLSADALATIERESGGSIAGVRCDVRVESDVAALAAAAVDRFGRLDIAFANAGVGTNALVTDIDRADFMNAIEVNLVGPMLMIKHAAPRMTLGGSIIITSSLNGVQPSATLSAYCCSKAGAIMLAQVAAMELGSRGIRVNAIGPGLVRTPLTERAWQFSPMLDEYNDNALLPTDTSADDVANLVTFLASDESSSITASFNLIDRGAHTKRYPDVLALMRPLAE